MQDREFFADETFDQEPPSCQVCREGRLCLSPRSHPQDVVDLRGDGQRHHKAAWFGLQKRLDDRLLRIVPVAESDKRSAIDDQRH